MDMYIPLRQCSELDHKNRPCWRYRSSVAISKTIKTKEINSVDCLKKDANEGRSYHATGLITIIKLFTHTMCLRRTEILSDRIRDVSRASDSSWRTCRSFWHGHVSVWFAGKLVPMEMIQHKTKLPMKYPVLKSRKKCDQCKQL